MKFHLTKKKTIILSIFTLFIAISLSVSSIFAWFMMNDQTSELGDVLVGITSSSTLDMSIDVTEPDGTPTKNFTNVLPSDVYNIKLTIINYDTVGTTIDVLFHKLIIKVLTQDELQENRTVIGGVTMLDVFAIRCSETQILKSVQHTPNYPPNSPTPPPTEEFVYLNKLANPDNTVINVLNKYPINALSTTVLNFQLQFMNKVIDKTGAEIKEVTNGGVTTPITINVFQLQKFHIGILEIKNNPAV